MAAKGKVVTRKGYSGAKTISARNKHGDKPGGGAKGKQLGVKGSGHIKRKKK